MITVIVERVVHDSGIRVALKFPYEKEIIKIVRTFPDAIWDKNLKYWHIAQSRGINGKIVKALIEVARIEFKSGRNKKVIEKVREKVERAVTGLESVDRTSQLPDKVRSVVDPEEQELSRHEFVDDSALSRKDLAERIRDARNAKEQGRNVKSRSFPLASKEFSVSKTDNNPEEETGQPTKYHVFKQGPTLEADPGTIPVNITINHLVTTPKTNIGQRKGEFSDSASEKAPDANPGTPRKTVKGFANKTFPESVPVSGSGMISRNDGDFYTPAAGTNYILSQQAEYDLNRYRGWLESHRYPPNTVRTYTTMMELFLNFVAPKEASDCDANDLVRMVNEYILPRGLSYSYQNQLISAIKKFYREICRETIDPGTFTRPRTRHKLPNVLSKEEVRKILLAPIN